MLVSVALQHAVSNLPDAHAGVMTASSISASASIGQTLLLMMLPCVALLCVCFYANGCDVACRPGTWMGTESFLLIVAAVAYGYTATMLLFGTFHCLSIVCGEHKEAACRQDCFVRVATRAYALSASGAKALGMGIAADHIVMRCMVKLEMGQPVCSLCLLLLLMDHPSVTVALLHWYAVVLFPQTSPQRTS